MSRGKPGKFGKSGDRFQMEFHRLNRMLKKILGEGF
jgi:hypothetical protein